MHVSHVLVGPEPQFQELAEAALKVMKEAELAPLSARSAINKLLERTQGAG